MSLFVSPRRTSIARIACLVVMATTLALAQGSPAVTPEGSLVQKVWHLGRVTGDLHRIIDFYHDVIGLNLRGARSPIPFYSVAAINEFVDAPAHAEFRAAFLPIQGTSAATVAADQIYLEAFEYRNIDRRQMLPPLTTAGASSLRLLVRDLNAVVAKAKAANVSVLTAGGEAVPVPAPSGMAGTARAVMLRDPDGYPVELMELSPQPPTFAPAESPVLGAHMVVVVDDLAASLEFYRRLVGTELQASAPSDWQTNPAVSRLRAIPDLASRTASIRLPGSAIALELVEYRDAPSSAYRPVFQDIGHGHVAFMVKDIQETVQRMKAAGATSISKAGTWTQINATTRAVYTRDPDGFFIEILERR